MRLKPLKPPDCPCGRLDAKKKPLALPACCGAYLDDFAGSPAPDAESLMRSRYSAFVLGRSNYLLATWHASTRPPHVERDASAKWLGLEVRSYRVLDASHAEVEFVARHRDAGAAQRLRERSRFVREDGRWWYLDGAQF